MLQFYKKEMLKYQKILVNSQPGIKPTESFLVSYLSTIQLTYSQDRIVKCCPLKAVELL